MILVNDRDSVQWHPEMTVSDVLKAMNYDFALIVVSVNGKIIPVEEYSRHMVPDNADFRAIHIHHGG